MSAGDAGLRPGRTVELEILALDGTARARKDDAVVTEEPLELRLEAGGSSRVLGLTMRTPGNDFELAAGFAVGEGIVGSRDELATVDYCLDPAIDPDQRYNVVTLTLARPDLPAVARLERHFVTSSACGVCGRAQLDSLRERGVAPLDDATEVSAETIYSLPERMRVAQRVFASTGGLHAAALFDRRGELLALREDVGRHNAVDKIVGWALMTGRLPLRATVLMVSGRAGYEIVQKAAVARIPIVCSVSAPSSLAVDLAREFAITLAGFVRGSRANVYSAAARILPSMPDRT
ncbi:MAG TPA: formate dehydrogenase accessory sulfurtransferase FdhD [Candidatus Tumulicola sp.]|nr:formate dehydrogenase accessory sulfurtransferase FdhD [Candidatus Tumulicola sp.]